jgi:hypothetical protein
MAHIRRKFIDIYKARGSAAKNIHAWWKGALPLEDVPFEVVVDGAVKGGLAAAGGFAGSSLLADCLTVVSECPLRGQQRT